jgi:peptidoglycan-associated lipoprotein
MTFSIFSPLRMALVVGTLALAACSQGGLNGDGADGADGVGGAAGAAGAAGAGGVNDPSSPVYFNQVVGDRILFAVDQSTLSPEAQTVLAGQAQWLTSNPEFTALIEGHADEQGTREYNLALGARRAAAVREYLISQGVAESRLRTISYGKERPLQVCSTEACYSQNRRSVTVISAGLGA